MMRWIAILAVMLWSTCALAQALPPPLRSIQFPFSDEQLRDLVRCRGCDHQVIDPDATLAKYGSNLSIASGWTGRVLASAAYRPSRQEDPTCTKAVRSLFKFICDGDEKCPIETRYDEKCLKSSTDDRTARTCVEVVDAYAQLCFGTGCPPGFPRRPENTAGVILKNRYGKAFCSGSGFLFRQRVNGSERTFAAIATAPHCDAGSDTIVEGERGKDRESLRDRVRVMSNSGIAQGLNIFEVAYLFPFLLGVQRPVLFAETVFHGFNSLVQSRDELNAARKVNNRTYGALRCDASPLCTIVGAAPDGRIVHTCQTTKGGSGGALLQRSDRGWVLVGINNGSPSRGVVVENDGLAVAVGEPR